MQSKSNTLRAADGLVNFLGGNPSGIRARGNQIIDTVNSQFWLPIVRRVRSQHHLAVRPKADAPYVLDPLSKFVHQAGMQSILNMFALAPIDELSLASSSPKVDRKFPLQSSSEYLQRQGNFARYDTSTGQIIYRVDISGRADAGVPTPHLHYPKYNILPTTGEMILNDWYSPVPYFDAIQVLNPTTQSLLLLFGLIGQ